MSNFGRQLDKAFDVKVLGTLDKRIRRTALAVDAQLVLTTPVDTGRARSNWVPSINTPQIKIVEPGQRESIGEAIKNYELDQTIFITNSLPYIRSLNDGHSQQAPAGFVDLAIQAGVRAANGL